MTQSILIVEDNAITRKLLRVTLEAEGYAVREAADARTAVESFARETPSLVLQDLVLPDVDGTDLVRQLRGLSGGADVPILAVTGLTANEVEARTSVSLFDEILLKPVEPSRLVEAIRRFRRARAAAPGTGAGRSVLLVDDDHVLRKLARIQLTDLGFRVTAVENGALALEEAMKHPPDAILSDVMMPEMDGFELCLSVREDPVLRDIPVVLVSAHYVEEADQDLARRVGANALIGRSAGLDTAIGALVRGLDSGHAPRATGDATHLRARHVRRLMAQLERQAKLGEEGARRCALQGAALGMIRRLCDVLARSADIRAALEDALYMLSDICGASVAALYVRDDANMTCVVSPHHEAAGTSKLRDFLAGWEPVARALEADTVVQLGEFEPDAAQVFSGCGASGGVLVPVHGGGKTIGVLVLGFEATTSLGEDVLFLVRTVAVQFGQAVALQRAFATTAKAERRYRELLENATDGVWILSPEGILLEANKRVEELHGQPRAQMVGRHFSEFVAPGHVDAERARFEQFLRAGEQRIEGVHVVRADGSVVIVDYSCVMVPLGDESVIIAIEHDVTERNRLQEQLLQAQKMEAIGQLTGGIAHDFNNMLAAIMGNAYFLLQSLGEGDPRRADAEEIEQAARRSAALTQQLLAFSRRQVLTPATVDLNAVTAALEPMLRRLIGEDIELSVAHAAGLGSVHADIGQIEQVIMNLVINARDAMPQGGRLRIETANVDLDEAYASSHASIDPGRYVMLAVSDSGCGMDAETQRRAFEPFFTTKPIGKGTGLGLSTIYGIVKQSGGHVWLYSEPGHGTTFKIYLPRTDARLETDVSVRPARGLAGSETLLVLEDDPLVRRTVQRALVAHGYHVLVAGGADEALATSAQHAGPIQMLVSDVVMPGTNGPEIVAELRARHPEAKVLFMSGYTEHPAFRDGNLSPGTSFIQKPFTPVALAKKVREVLDATQ